MQKIAVEEELEVLQPELGTKPRIYYKNMHLLTSCFVGGTVVKVIDGIEECAEGAEVVVKQDGNEVGRVTTDTFGEFKIDKLAPNSGSYQIEVSAAAGKASTSVEVKEDSPYVGVLTLAA